MKRYEIHVAGDDKETFIQELKEHLALFPEVFGFDMTQRVLETLEWMTRDYLAKNVDAAYAGLALPCHEDTCDPQCEKLTVECCQTVELSPEMRTAVAALADLRLGHVKCLRDKPLVYLACPYSHPDPQVRERRFHAANVAAARLMSLGEFVFSPISHTHPMVVDGELPPGFDYWERYDSAILSVCHKLYVLQLEGWRLSVGIQAEAAIAQEMGIPVVYMEAV